LEKQIYKGFETPLTVAESYSTYTAKSSTTIEESIDTLIAEARKAMEDAAKQLDFQGAAKHRDRMYELQKIKESSSKR
jgi:excinuclease ABC subunit B